MYRACLPGVILFRTTFADVQKLGANMQTCRLSNLDECDHYVVHEPIYPSLEQSPSHLTEFSGRMATCWRGVQPRTVTSLGRQEIENNNIWISNTIGHSHSIVADPFCWQAATKTWHSLIQAIRYSWYPVRWRGSTLLVLSTSHAHAIQPSINVGFGLFLNLCSLSEEDS